MAKGQKTGGAVKGQTYAKVTLWNEMGDFIVCEGTDKYMEFLRELKGKEYMERFEAILEYFKPKMSRVALTDGEGKALFTNPDQKLKADQIIQQYLGENKTNIK